MRLHVVSLPWTETTRAFDWCAYTAKVRRFSDMMTARGHDVFLYAGPANEAACAEHVVVTDAVGCPPEFTPDAPHWQTMNDRAIRAIRERMEPHDLLCVIAGLCQQPIAHAIPLMCVEFGVGYGGTFADFRVFESYAWMHTVYGHQQGTHSADGRFYDTVIPNYFDVDDFPAGDGQGGYLLFIGRHIARKGVQIAADVARHLDARLIVAGDGPEPPNYGELVGVVDPPTRAQLMGGARAVLVPTLYVEPFGGVAVEAMMCGTPVITTDFGAFTETVVDGVTGFRCHTLQEFVDAARDVSSLDRRAIREYAVGRYSLQAIGPAYERYFDRLAGLWEGGWPAVA